MPSYRDIYLNLYGVWRLLHLDAAALGWFDASVEGYWKSFFAAALVLPVYVLSELLLPSSLSPDAVAAPFGIKAAANFVTYVYLWIAYPFVMLPVATMLGRSDRYLRYIVAYNWAVVWQFYFLLPATALAATGADIGMTVLGLAYLLVAAFVWYIARTALAISGIAALGVLVLDGLLSYFIQRLNVFLMT